jgi:hypothetical protein
MADNPKDVDPRLMPCVRALARAIVVDVLEELRNVQPSTPNARPMIWRFNDGTTAELGGRITGASAFAGELRAMLARPRTGVAFGAMPDGGAWLDVNDPALFDAWLTPEAQRPFRAALQLELIERPANIPPLPEQHAGELPPGAIA